jgi:hypothetical protein
MKCQSSGSLRISFHGPTPGKRASIMTNLPTGRGYWVAKA